MKIFDKPNEHERLLSMPWREKLGKAKTYRGYPAEVHIDGKDMTVHDVERLILSLYWDKEIPEDDNDRLMTDYKQERQRWLDGLFVRDEENTSRIEEVARMLTAAYDRLKETAETFVTEQLAHGDESAKRIVIHIEVDDQLGGQSEGITDEDAELWDALCNEDRHHYDYWGVYCFSVDLNDKRMKMRDLLWWKDERMGKEPNETAEQQLSTLRERYYLAWQDIIKIPRFIMTVEIER